MKNTKVIVLTVILIIVCTLISTLVNRKDKTINYTFFINNDSKISMYNNYGKRIIKDDLTYAEKFNDDYTLIVNTNNESAIIDKYGDFIINFGEYDTIEEYGRLYLAYKGEDAYLITGNNRLIRKIESKSEIVSKIVRNYVALLYDGNYYVYNSKGEILFSRKYKKKKQIVFKESSNYGLVYYDGKEYLFNIDGTEYEERDVKKVSNLEEFNNILLVTGDTNRVYYKNERVIDNLSCKYPKIDEADRVLCKEEVVFESELLNDIKNYKKIENYGEYYLACNEKCDLFKNNEKVLTNYDEIRVINTNIDDYFYVKDKNTNIILNNKYELIFSTKKDLEIEDNYIKMNNKLYTFEGNEINI